MVEILRSLLVNAPLDSQREEGVKVKEVAILKLGEVLAKHGFADGKFVCLV